MFHLSTRHSCSDKPSQLYFTVNPGASLTFLDVGIFNGDGAGTVQNTSMIDNNGGTVTISPQLSTTGCLFSNHKSAPPEFGGVIFNRSHGTVIIGGADFEGSSATSDGGAIFNQSGTLKLVGSPGIATNILQNSATRGAGIYNDHDGSIQLVDDRGNHVVIADNAASAFGGGIFNAGGIVQITSSNFSISENNAALGGGIYTQGGKLKISRGVGQVMDIAIASNEAEFGAGIYDIGSKLNISGVEIKGNSASGNGAMVGGGGGIVLQKDRAAITQTYFHDNTTAVFGGGVLVADGATLAVSASTFARDTAQLGGDGIEVQGTGQITLTNSTLTDGIDISNSDGTGAQIVSSSIVGARLSVVIGSPTSMTVRSSILQGATCAGVGDSGRNLQFQSIYCAASTPTADPLLDPQGLAFNGGPTPTITLLNGSHAIDAVPLTACTDQNGKRLKTDQRGFARPAPRHRARDTGAFEFGARQSNTKGSLDSSGLGQEEE